LGRGREERKETTAEEVDITAGPEIGTGGRKSRTVKTDLLGGKKKRKEDFGER